MTAIQAAHLEAAQKGTFTLTGRTIKFRAAEGMEYKWHARTAKEAAQQLRLFRAAPKHTKAT